MQSMHEEPSFVSLLIVVALAAVVPMLVTQVRRVRIPIVVGEILAGILVGASGLNLVRDDPWLSMLSTLGFSYLMFLSGLEVDFGALINQMSQIAKPGLDRFRSPALLASISFLFALAAAFGLSLGLQAMGLVHDAALMGLILSTTSLGIVVPTLKERGEVRTAYGQTLLIAALLADFITMLLISIYVIFHANGLTPEMLMVLALLGAFFTAYRLMLALQRHPPLEELFRKASEAVGHLRTRGAFAIGLAFIALAEWLGVEVILGAFLGGALIALLSEEEHSALREYLDVMGYSFFIPIFFVMVGVRFDLRSLLSSRQTVLLAPALIAMAYLIKLVPSLIFRFAYDWRRSVGAGVLLSSRLSLVIAAAAIGLDMGAIDPAVNSAIILLAIITCTLSPALFNRIVPPEESPTRSMILIVGSDQEAIWLAQRLRDHEDPVVLVLPPDSPTPPRLEDIAISRLERIESEALRAIGATRAKTLVALLENDADNLRLCQIAKAALGVHNVVARVQNAANLEAYIATGVRPVTKTSSEVTVLENLASNPNVFTLLSEEKHEQEIIELEVLNPALADIPLHSLHLPGEALVMMIQRDGHFIVPRGDARLELNDVVVLLASPAEAREARTLFTEKNMG